MKESGIGGVRYGLIQYHMIEGKEGAEHGREEKHFDVCWIEAV